MAKDELHAKLKKILANCHGSSGRKNLSVPELTKSLEWLAEN